MIKKHIEIADRLLKIFKDNGGVITVDVYSSYLTKNGAEMEDLVFVESQLLMLKLIEFVGEDRYRAGLTTRGEMASEVGLERFLEMEGLTYNREEVQLVRSVNKTNLKIIMAYCIAIIISVIAGIILGLIIFKWM